MIADDVRARHYLDMARRAEKSGRDVFTDFLESGEEEACVRQAAAEAGVRVEFFGGYEDAERRMAVLRGGGDETDWPIECLAITYRTRFGSVDHRSILGSVMALGLVRALYGDIVPGADDAGDAGEGIGLFYLYCTGSGADTVLRELTDCGRTSVKVKTASLPVVPREAEGTPLRVTLSSPRMDAVISAALKLSRAKAKELIEQGLAKRNRTVETRPDTPVEEGDMLSVRGSGRLKVVACTGETKKGRLAYSLIRY